MTFDDLVFKPHPGRPHFNIQAKVTLANGMTVSVIRGPMSYGGKQGLYEMAVQVLPGSHPIGLVPDASADPIGGLTPDEITVLLWRLEAWRPDLQ